MNSSHDSIVKVRNALMISSNGSDLALREGHFLEPSRFSIGEPLFEIPQDAKWNTWVDRMVPEHVDTWREAGIYEAVLNSTYRFEKNTDLIYGLVEKWCKETKSFIFRWGEATITLEDVVVCGGFSVLGDPIHLCSETGDGDFKNIKSNLQNTRKQLNQTTYKKVGQSPWMAKFMDRPHTENDQEVEHEAILAL
ncbi:hypothetical protein ACFE04_009902 [Oxalis oulophora]